VAVARRLTVALAAGIAAAAVVLDQPLPRDFAWKAKIAPEVLGAPAETEQELLVVLGEQADLSGARDLPTRVEKARYVFERLTETAARSQTPLLAELDAARVPHRSFWIVNMVQVRARPERVEALARRADVARIEANAPRLQRLPLPESPIPSSGRSASSALAAGPETNIQRIGAPAVWATGVTGQGVVVAGADTGYDWTHPALKGKYRGWNGATADHNYNWHDAVHDAAKGNPCKSNAAAPCDDDSHGTHTMGIAVGDDGAGNQIGVAPGARWIGCRNMDRGVGTPARYTECFQWFLAPTNSAGANPDPAKSPDVINNSWDCPPSEGCTNPDTLKNVIENVRAAGILVVVAGGNDGPACSSMDVPETFEAVLDVGATDAADAVASFSSRGPGQNGSIKPQVLAPGTSIRSSIPGGGYATMSGTSMSAPHGAGLAALLLSAAPSLSGNVTGLEVLMEQTAVAKTTTETCGGIAAGAVPNNTGGWGRIDALAAVSRAVAANSPPSVSLSSPADGAAFTAPAAIPLAATVSDDGFVARVDFFAGSARVATDLTSPFSFNWTGVAAGTYLLTAVATDNAGATTASSPITVTVASPSTTLPPGWLEQDIGAVGLAGSASYAGGAFTVLGSGADVYGSTDQFHFVYQPMSGSGEIVARVASVANTNSYAKAGVMIRQDLTTGSPYAMMEILPRKSSAFQWRLTAGGTTSSVASTGAAPYWVKLVRNGNVFTAYQSADGASWTAVGSAVTVSLTPNVLVGLAVTAHANTTTCASVFDHVSLSFAPPPNAPPIVAITGPSNGAAIADPTSVAIVAQASDPDGSIARVDFFDGTLALGTSFAPPYTFDWSHPPAGPHTLTARATDDGGAATTSAAVGITVSYSSSSSLPSPWQQQDVGAVGVAGSATFANGAFTVLGSGTDAYGVADQFHFVYQPMSGDGEIVARVASVANTNSYAKAGVMIRQDLSTSAPDAMMEMLPRRSSAFQWRLTAGGTTSSVASTGAAPYWVRLVRVGNVITAYQSANGASWTAVGSPVTVVLSPNVYVGLAVTSHANTTTCAAVFDNVAVTP
jgi:serine protease AprX